MLPLSAGTTSLSRGQQVKPVAFSFGMKGNTKMNIEQIAELAHEANRVYCKLLGDDSQKSWTDAAEWQKKSAISWVKYRLEHPMSTAQSQHEAWLKDKADDGWKHSPVKDPEKKEHPCCVPYDQLPLEQRIKDILFLNIVEVMRPLLGR